MAVFLTNGLRVHQTFFQGAELGVVAKEVEAVCRADLEFQESTPPPPVRALARLYTGSELASVRLAFFPDFNALSLRRLSEEAMDHRIVIPERFPEMLKAPVCDKLRSFFSDLRRASLKQHVHWNSAINYFTGKAQGNDFHSDARLANRYAILVLLKGAATFSIRPAGEETHHDIALRPGAVVVMTNEALRKSEYRLESEVNGIYVRVGLHNPKDGVKRKNG